MSYHNASPDRSVSYRPEGGSVETATNALPVKLVAIVDLGGDLVKVTMVVDRFGQEGDGLRLGVQSIEVEANEGESLTTDMYRRVPFHGLVLYAIQKWSHNSDLSPVTLNQARALTRPGARRTKSPEERWQEVADVYLAAKDKGEPTTVAVAQALHLGTSKRGQDAARSLVRRARQAGYLPPARKDN